MDDHLATCAPCSALLEELSSTAPRQVLHRGAADQAEIEILLHQVKQTLSREQGVLARLRALSTSWRLSVAGAGVVSLSLLVFFLAPRADIAAYPALRMFLTATVVAVLAGGVIALSLRPLHRGDVAPVDWSVALAGLGAPFVVALLPRAELSQPVSHGTAGEDCLMVGAACGASLIALLKLLDQRPPGAAPFMLARASAGGLVANFALTIHCPIVEPPHLVAIHAPLGVVLLLTFFLLRSATTRSWRLRRA